MNPANKIKLVIFLGLVATALLITKLFIQARPSPMPTPPGTAAPPTNKSLLRRFVPKSLLPPPPEPALQVVSVNPPPNEKRAGLFKPIQISFNQTVDPREVKVLVSPNLTLSSPVATRGTTLVLNHQEPFQAKTRYTISVLLKNKLLLSWSFTTAENQYDSRLFEERKQYYQENLPLLPFVPFESERVLINYIGPKKLRVTLKKDDQQSAKAEVFDWMRSHGVNPDSHEIEWVQTR